MLVASPLAMGGGGDPAVGSHVAQRWCITCHVVDATATKGSDAVPPLPSIRTDPRMTPQRLGAFLTEPHGGMKGMSFSRQEIDDLIAYIATLGD